MDSDCFDMPPEFLSKPQPLIGISGLDTKNNAVHKSIWEAFTSNRHSDRAAAHFKLIDNAHEFPIPKPKRNSYEWYLPKGILKRNWMHKHMYEVPAVMVVFYDLDWNDPLWNERMIECVSRIQSMRAALQDRQTRITIVLIQSVLPMPAGEDVQATERASALCASGELNAKNLFVLPMGDHLQGYVVRLEGAFIELASNYYSMKMKTIKSHREHLNKTSHQFLLVRHQFKMAFFSAMKQDANTAHKHYTHAYNNLVELRIVDTNANEIRTVAGYINYNLCKVMFHLNLPRDAIQQFRAHTDRYKARIGFQELAFEHHAWLSKQYWLFGDTFEEAVRHGLPAVQIQHPGLYYQQAAQYAIQRRKTAEDLCKSVLVYPKPDPLEGSATLEFFGQRPWRPGKVGSESTDPKTEVDGILAIQFLEKQFNHSELIIKQYGSAISQYKTYRCPRMRRQLVVQMADEYYIIKDYGKALTLYMHMLSDYRVECWWPIQTNLIEKALKCSYLTGSAQDYIVLALEAMGPKTLLSIDHKKSIYENLNRILSMQTPQPEPNVPSMQIKSASTLWNSQQSQPKLNISLDISSIQSCIECKTRFPNSTYQIDEVIAIEIYLRNISNFPLLFSRISATTNTTTYSNELTVNASENFKIEANETVQYFINFKPNPSDIDMEIHIGNVNLNLGNSVDNIVDLKFTISNSTNAVDALDMNHFKRRAANDQQTIDFDRIRPTTSCMLIARQSNLQVVYEHEDPALLEEWHPIKIVLENNELHSVSSLNIDLVLDNDNADNTIEFSLKPNGAVVKPPLQFESASLEVGSKTSFEFYIKSTNVCSRIISTKVSFTLDSPTPIASMTSSKLKLTAVKPFEISAKFMTELFEDASKFYMNEKFVIMPIISCLSLAPLYIVDAQLQYDMAVTDPQHSSETQLANTELAFNEIAADMYLGSAKKACDHNITVGQYTIKWRRQNGNIVTETTAPVIGLKVDWIPLHLSASLPEFGVVRTPLPIQYHLHNRSQHLIQLDVALEGSEAFMFAGYKQFQVSILPDSTKTLTYNLYPLIAGGVALPRLQLNIPENSIESPALRQEHLKQLTTRSLPIQLFIMPQAKKEETSSTPTIPNHVFAI